MKISAVAPQYMHVGKEHGVHANRHATGTEKHHHDERKVHEADDDHFSARDLEGPGDRKKGDFSLHQAGNFKGVADVHLSIKIHIELSGTQKNTAHARVSESVSDLDDAMSHALKAIPDGSDEAQGQAIRKAQKEFSSSIQSAVQDFRSGSVGQEAFISGISEAYEELSARVQSALAGTPPVSGEKNSAEPVPVDTSVVKVDDELHDAVQENDDDVPQVDGPVAADTEQYLANLGQIFHDAISRLQTDIAAVSDMPGFQLPNGNGGVFEKFLSIYRELVDAMAGDDGRVVDEAAPGMAVDEQV